MKKILTLVIDGMGISDNEIGNAIKLANMPNYKDLLEKYPHSSLVASGSQIGLGEGQVGNEEIGYKTIGAGKVMRQRSSFMNAFVDVDSLATNSKLKTAIEHVKKYKSTIHIMGLMSDGGVESNIKDTIKIIEFLKTQDVKIVVDFIADGKNVEVKSALKYVEMIEETEVPIASICGRYYAMDTEGKWDRIKIYYDLIRNGVGLKVKEVPLALKNCYIRNITDEYLPPIVATQNKNIKNGDVVLWTNYESESAKEILLALEASDEAGEVKPVEVEDMKMLVMYPIEGINATPLIEEEEDNANNLGIYLSKLNMTQARIGLSSNYENVTYYFNGGKEVKISKCNNYQVDVPKTDINRPLELGAASITKQAIRCMERDIDFILAGFDCIDKIAHTGNLEETVKILEFLDECIGKIMESASLNFYTVVITSSHGNAEEMKNEEGNILTTHTLNKVPFIITDSKLSLIDGALTDIAPTILKYMDISIPESMIESKILIEEN